MTDMMTSRTVRDIIREDRVPETDVISGRRHDRAPRERNYRREDDRPVEHERYHYARGSSSPS